MERDTPTSHCPVCHRGLSNIIEGQFTRLVCNHCGKTRDVSFICLMCSKPTYCSDGYVHACDSNAVKYTYHYTNYGVSNCLNTDKCFGNIILLLNRMEQQIIALNFKIDTLEASRNKLDDILDAIKNLPPVVSQNYLEISEHYGTMKDRN